MSRHVSPRILAIIAALAAPSRDDGKHENERRKKKKKKKNKKKKKRQKKGKRTVGVWKREKRREAMWRTVVEHRGGGDLSSHPPLEG